VHGHILGMRVDATSYLNAAARVLEWARAEASRGICVATVHPVMGAMRPRGDSSNGGDHCACPA
jgi:hypothetical protein